MREKEYDTKRGSKVVDVYKSFDDTVFTETAEGYLAGRAIVTCIGVFPYLQEDGSVFNELRLPEEVFSPASLDSLRCQPITDDHPADLVTSENAKALQVGMTGEDVSRLDLGIDFSYGYKTDGSQVSIPLKITDKTVIDKIKAGKRALSCGYTRRLELTSGTWGGVGYDGIQRDIRYNHVAIVDRGRAGDAAVIRMDGADVPTFLAKDDAPMLIDDKETIMEKITLDGCSQVFEVDERIKARLDSLESQNKGLSKDKGVLEAERSRLDEANKALETKVAELQKKVDTMIDPSSIGALVKERQEIADAADVYHVSLEEGMSALDMKKAIIKVVNPSMADSIDKKDSSFIDGMFSVYAGKKADGLGSKKVPGSEGTAPKADAAGRSGDVDDKYDAAISVLGKKLASPKK